MPTEIFCDKIVKEQKNIWNHILFHPTDAIEDDWGIKILDTISADKAAQVVRIYSMMEDIVSMDGHGKLHYDFTLSDIRLDYLIKKGFIPMIAYGGIPACIAIDPYESSSAAKNKTRYKGKMWITSPPKYYEWWEEICREYTKHVVERYGEDEVSRWYIHCFNEADIPMFFMHNATDEQRLTEYCKLFDHFYRAVTDISKKLRIGGPGLAGKVSFLEGYLTHAIENGQKLDYVCFHNYGAFPPAVESGEQSIDVNNQFVTYERYYNIIKKYFPEGKETVQDEWGAMAWGFADAEQYPCLLFRETEKYASYYAQMIIRFVKEYEKADLFMICLSGQHEMQSEFEGFRNFFSLHFIKKPVYNAYVLAGKLNKYLLKDSSDNENLKIMATKADSGKISALFTFATSDFKEDIGELNETIKFNGISGKKKISVYKIDENNTNPYRVFKQKGWDKNLTCEQIEYLKEISNLKPETYEALSDGSLAVNLKLTRNGTALIEVEDCE